MLDDGLLSPVLLLISLRPRVAIVPRVDTSSGLGETSVGGVFFSADGLFSFHREEFFACLFSRRVSTLTESSGVS